MKRINLSQPKLNPCGFPRTRRQVKHPLYRFQQQQRQHDRSFLPLQAREGTNEIAAKQET